MKKFIVLVFLLTALCCCSRPQGFTLKKIESKHPYNPKWEVPLPPQMEAIRDHLAQPFTYLGSGNHTYAFVSEDGNYVLKFFKQKHMRTKRFFYSTKRLQRRISEREESFTSYKIAYEMLPKETGVIYLHLNKTQELLPTIDLIDPQGNTHKIALDRMEFLLQEKAVLAFEYLGSILDNKKELLDAIDSLLSLIATRNQKGIYDKDLQFYKNFGFREGAAMEVDVGEFKLNRKPRNTFEETHEVSLQIRDFIQEKAPELLPDAEKRMERTLKRLSRHVEAQ